MTPDSFHRTLDAALEQQRGVVAVAHVLTTHADPEEYARIFNEGYEAAMTQHLADDPSAADDWLADQIVSALREAADAVSSDCRNSSAPCFCGSADWLRERAARIARSEAGA